MVSGCRKVHGDKKFYFYVYYMCKSCFFNKEVNHNFMLHRTSHVSHSGLKWTSLRQCTAVVLVNRQMCIVDNI